jgi:SAM-dependent methyltransferase
MSTIYRNDLAYIHAVAFENLARDAVAGIIGRLRNAAVPVRRVTDVGCGAGPLAAALSDAGFAVTGIDLSADLLVIARAAVPSAKFVRGSAYDVEIEPCEAVIALGEPLTYHEDPVEADSRVRRFFRRVSDALPRGGLLVFDLIETGEPSLSGRSWMSGPDWAVLVDTAESADGRTLVRNIETFRRAGEHYRRGYEVHKVRLFDSETILAELAAAGFGAETATSYGAQPLPRRRRAFFCEKQ